MRWHSIAPGKPQQNGFIESFNGRMRDEVLNVICSVRCPTPVLCWPLGDATTTKQDHTPNPAGWRRVPMPEPYPETPAMAPTRASDQLPTPVTPGEKRGHVNSNSRSFDGHRTIRAHNHGRLSDAAHDTL